MSFIASPLTLVAGDLVVELLPDVGGSVASFRLQHGDRRINLMRQISEEARATRDVVGAAMFPMVPYANRIADNRFSFEGREYLFKQNYTGERLNVHGSAWRSAWAISVATESTAELVLRQSSPDDPYSYLAVQRFVLLPDRLTVVTAVTNCGVRTMPFGFGQHPFWVREPNVTLKFNATHFWLSGPDSVATDRISVPIELDFGEERLLPRTWRNNCYAGWDGLAELKFPDSGFGLRIEADPIFRHLMLYADPNQSVFCVEPQTNAVCALNRIGSDDEDLGVLLLEPGASAEGEISFVPFLT